MNIDHARPIPRSGPRHAALVLSLSLLCGRATADQSDSPTQLRRFIDQQVGGIDKPMVPSTDAALPQPRFADGNPDPFFQTTEAKRYLGKQLFHDPIRTARILPEFGCVTATKQTASCGSCHFGEAASKPGTLLPVYRKLFRDPFPDKAAQAPACTPHPTPSAGSCDTLINDVTVLRATATFMRTAVTRNTPWDRFLAGANGALTEQQRRGAKLFFSSADKGGAGCYSCHSGPMLNKHVNDPDVADVGLFVEENFYNLALRDYPLQALNVLANKNPKFRDDDRREITARDSDAFKFRVLTLRQLKDARFFFHNGAFTSVKDVVKYFNAGVRQNQQAVAAVTLTPRFTTPRGAGSPFGLGLCGDKVDALVDFLENGLYARHLRATTAARRRNCSS